MLIFTNFEQRPSVMRAIRAGASGFTTKDKPVDEVVDTLLTIRDGKRTINEDPAAVLADMIAGQNNAEPSDVELIEALHTIPNHLKKVVPLLVEGKSNRIIAKELHTSEGTAGDYVSEVLKLTNCESRTSFVVKVFKSKARFQAARVPVDPQVPAQDSKFQIYDKKPAFQNRFSTLLYQVPVSAGVNQGNENRRPPRGGLRKA